MPTRKPWNICVTSEPPKLKQAKAINTASTAKNTAEISRFASGDNIGSGVLLRRELERLVFFAGFLAAIPNIISDHKDNRPASPRNAKRTPVLPSFKGKTRVQRGAEQTQRLYPQRERSAADT